jgi:putative membrane protein
MKPLLSALTLAGLLSVALPARAQERTDSTSDDHFVAKAATCGSTEVELGKWALRNGMNPQVRSFGQHLVDDHARANQQLLTLAGKKQIGVPKTIDAKQQEEINRLSRLQGAEFDREFAKRMIKNHKEAIELFEKQSENGKDPELKAFATQTLPKLKEHLRTARALAGENEDGSKSTQR